MKDLTIDLCKVSIEVEPEYTPIQTALGFKETGADHSEYIAKVLKDDGFNPWLWCTVKVNVDFNGLHGYAYLGQCAYENEEDFKKGGYFEQMQEEAFEMVKRQLEVIMYELQ